MTYKKIKAQLLVPTGVYANLKCDIDLDVPENLNNVELVQYLWDTYHNIFERERPSHKETKASEYKGRRGLLQARKEGFDVDNSPYLNGEEDEGAKIANAESRL